MNSPSRDHAHTATGATPDGAATNDKPSRGVCAQNHDRIVELVGAGLSGSEIAAQLGTTRNAVLGHCHRRRVTLPLTAEKRAKQRHRPRKPRTPKSRPMRLPSGHPSRRSRPFGKRAFSDAQIATAIATHLAGMSGYKAARSVGACWGSLRNWLAKPELMRQGRALYERAAREAAVVAARRVAIAEFEAETTRLRIEANNAPILARMPARHRLICERRIAGQNGQQIGSALGLTRERIRQIAYKWMACGLIIPDARPLSEVALRTFAPKPQRIKKTSDPFYAIAHRELKKERRPYRMSDAERERRRAWGRELGLRRSGAPA